MVLTKKGKKIKKNFQKEYGRKKGTSIFYAYERKHPDLLIPKDIIKVGLSIGVLGLGLSTFKLMGGK